MSRRLSDTIPETEAILTDLLRTPWRKLQMVDEMNALVRCMALSGLHERHPQVSSEELQRRLGTFCWGWNWRRRYTALERPTPLLS